MQGRWGLRKRVEAIGNSTIQRRLLQKQERVAKLLQDLDTEVVRIEGQLLEQHGVDYVDPMGRPTSSPTTRLRVANAHVLRRDTHWLAQLQHFQVELADLRGVGTTPCTPPRTASTAAPSTRCNQQRSLSEFFTPTGKRHHPSPAPSSSQTEAAEVGRREWFVYSAHCTAICGTWNAVELFRL